MVKLESYNGKNRYSCPKCGASRESVRYVDGNGEYISPEVGRCNREVKCGYHYKPKQYFSDNPNLRTKQIKPRKSTCPVESQALKKSDFIPANLLLKTLNNYGRNAFVEFLLRTFPETHVQNSVQKYFVGTWSDSRTVFWQVDTRCRIRTGKLILYNSETGKRIKTRNPSWVHAEIKNEGILKKEFILRQCFFGEHLLTSENKKIIGVVESEKTAIVADICIPDFSWVASGGCSNLRLKKLCGFLNDRKIVLFPDSSKFADWSLKAEQAKFDYNMDISVSTLLEERLTQEEKKQDYDLADFLLAGRLNQAASD